MGKGSIKGAENGDLSSKRKSSERNNAEAAKKDRHEEKPLANSKTLPPKGKEGKKDERKLRTLPKDGINGVQERKDYKSSRNIDESNNYQASKKEKARESLAVKSDNDYAEIRMDSPEKPKEFVKNHENSESKAAKNSEVKMRKNKEPHQMIKSKSTVGFDTNEPNHAEKDDVQAKNEMNRSFPSMMEIRANLQAGKRRTLLLNRGDSLEDRVDMLNNL